MTSKRSLAARLFPFSWKDLLVSAVILSCAIGLCSLLRLADSSDGFASPDRKSTRLNSSHTS